MRPLLVCLLALLLFVTVSTVTARRAEACGGEEGDVIIMVLGGAAALTALDIGLSIHDVAVDDSSTGYAVAETILTLPQVAISAFVIRESMMQSDVDEEGIALGVVALAWTGALFLHGVSEIIEGTRPARDDTAARRGTPKRRFAVAPTAVSDGASIGTGLAIAGTW